MRIIIAGSRTFDDYALLKRTMDKIIAHVKRGKGDTSIKIISGGAKGADKLGEWWAYKNMISYEVFQADWGKHGKAAGPIRNQEMIDEGKADALIVFWDGKSPGTKDMIGRARKAGLKIKIVKF